MNTKPMDIKIYCNHPEHNIYPVNIVRIRNNEYFVECPQCKNDHDKIEELNDTIYNLEEELNSYDFDEEKERIEDIYKDIKEETIAQLEKLKDNPDIKTIEEKIDQIIMHIRLSEID